MIVNTFFEGFVKNDRQGGNFCTVYRKFAVFSKKLRNSIAKEEKAWYNTYSKIR
jgi:hypothetical protein